MLVVLSYSLLIALLPYASIITLPRFLTRNCSQLSDSGRKALAQIDGMRVLYNIAMEGLECMYTIFLKNIPVLHDIYEIKEIS